MPEPFEIDPEAREPRGAIGWLFDILQRGQYASAAFFDSVGDEGLAALGSAWQEFFNPVERLSFVDLIKKRNPEWAHEHPIAAHGLGFIGDVALDPLTYVGMGPLYRIGKYGVSKLGKLQWTKEFAGVVDEAVKADGILTRLKDLTPEAVRTRTLDKITKRNEAIVGRVGAAPTLDEIRAATEEAINYNSLAIVQRKNLEGSVSKILKDHDRGVLESVIAQTRGGDAEGVIRDFTEKLGIERAEKEAKIITQLRTLGPKHQGELERLAREMDLPQTVQQQLFDEENKAIKQINDLIDRRATKGLERATKAHEKKLIAAGKRQVTPEAAEERVRKVTERIEEMRRTRQAVLETQYLQNHDAMLEQFLATHSEFLDAGGLKFFGKTIIPGSVAKKIGDITMINHVKEKIAETATFAKIAGTFNRFYKMPAEYVALAKKVENDIDAIGDDVIRRAKEIFMDLTEKESKELGRIGHEIQDATIDLGKNLGRQPNKQEAADLAQTFLTRLNPKQRAVYAKMRSEFDQILELGMQANLIQEGAMNYWPRIYGIIKDPVFYRSVRKGLSDFLPAGQRKEVEMFQQILKDAEQWKPELDAAVLYTTRAIEARKAIAHKEFNDTLRKIYKVKSLDQLQHSEKGRRIWKDIQFIGDSNYPEWLGSEMRGYMNLYDKTLSIFKKAATVIKPSFAVRQMVSNALQSYSVTGLKTLRFWDPRTYKDAIALTMWHNGNFPKEVAEKMYGHKTISVLGKEYTGEELVALSKQHGIIRGSNITGDSAKRNIRKELNRARLRQRIVGDDPKWQGLSALFENFARYTSWPSNVEDMARMNVFLNALRGGYNPAEAAGLVNKALFDYSHGLSRVERMFLRRVIPFYSFQRFAYPLIAKTLVTHPGRIQNVKDFTDNLMGVFNTWAGGETLTEAQRWAVPGFLLEQPQVFEKRDPETGEFIFKTFHNFSFLDVLGMVELDASENVDFRRSVEKMALAQMAPMFKMPLELLTGKNFFTDMAIAGTNVRAGKISAQDARGVLGNIMAMLGTTVGIPGIAAGKALGEVTPDIAVNAVKELIGWEEAIDQRTGKPGVYVNPWLAWAAQGMFPALNQAIRVDRPDFTPSEKAMDLIFGINTLKRNLPRDLKFKLDRQEKEIRELKAQITAARKAGRMDLAEQRRMELRELIEDIMAERAAVDLSTIQ